MARPAKWGEPKANYTLKVTPTAEAGVGAFAESLGMSKSDTMEFMGRLAYNPEFKEKVLAMLQLTKDSL